MCQGGLGRVPTPAARGHMFPGGTAASLVRAKCGGDGWSFCEVLLKGGLSDPVHLVKAESPWSKLVVVKLKGMGDRGQDSLSPCIHVLQEGTRLFPTRCHTALRGNRRVIQGSSKLI